MSTEAVIIEGNFGCQSNDVMGADDIDPGLAPSKVTLGGLANSALKTSELFCELFRVESDDSSSDVRAWGAAKCNDDEDGDEAVFGIISQIRRTSPLDASRSLELHCGCGANRSLVTGK